MAWFTLITLGSCVGMYLAGKILIGSANYIIGLRKKSPDPQDTHDECLDSSMSPDIQDVRAVVGNYRVMVGMESNKDSLDPVPEDQDQNRDRLELTAETDVVPLSEEKDRDFAAELSDAEHPGEDTQKSSTAMEDNPSSHECDPELMDAGQESNMEIEEQHEPDTAGVDDSSNPLELERTKQWFLVKSSTGQVRVCQAWEPTPKTIAGPFRTREEANTAKRM